MESYPSAQLHLAYDNGFNFKTYENYDEQLANLFFARMDAYSRTLVLVEQIHHVLHSFHGSYQLLRFLLCASGSGSCKNLLQKEAGGALYVQYTGNNANDKYAVRVSGGVQVPMLDLYQKMDDVRSGLRIHARRPSC